MAVPLPINRSYLLVNFGKIVNGDKTSATYQVFSLQVDSQIKSVSTANAILFDDDITHQIIVSYGIHASTIKTTVEREFS